MNTFKNKVLAGAIKVQNNVYMKAISNAMMGLMPIMMISSIASLINAIDIGNTQQIMDQIGLKSLLTQINAMTIDVISVYVAFLVGYKLAEHLNADQLNAGPINFKRSLSSTSAPMVLVFCCDYSVIADDC